MRYAIFSDIHANLQAYEAFLEDAKKEGIEEYFCAGDIVGYGADPHECIEITKRLGLRLVCGNHDWATAGKFDVENLNQDARDAVVWTRDVLDDTDKDYLGSLALLYQNSEFTIVHSSLDCLQDFPYVLNTAQAEKTIHIQSTPLCFAGHSHVAGVFFEDKNGYIHRTIASELSIEKGRRYLINVGSIGQPRDGDWRSSYCIYDTEKKNIRVKRVEYDVKKARDKILKTDLPVHLAERILVGR